MSYFKTQNTKRHRTRQRNTRRHRHGGASLAYPSQNVPKYSNTHLAYTGNPQLSKTYPAQGPALGGFNFIVPQTGGRRSALLSNKHRKCCKCHVCKHHKHTSRKSRKIRGGSCHSNGGIPYPNGLLGSPWTPSPTTWPGVDGIPMNNNHLQHNTYTPVDISRQMLNIGAQPPHSYSGGKRRNRKHKTLKGGTLSNFMLDDLSNLGNMIPYTLGQQFNSFNGYEQPVNPLPYKDQFTKSQVSFDLYA